MRAFVEPLEELSGFEEMTHNMQQEGLSRKQKNYTRITAFLIRRLSTIRQRMFCFTSPIYGEIC